MINLYLQDIYPTLGSVMGGYVQMIADPSQRWKVRQNAGIIEFATLKKDSKVQLQANLRCDS